MGAPWSRSDLRGVTEAPWSLGDCAVILRRLHRNPVESPRILRCPLDLAESLRVSRCPCDLTESPQVLRRPATPRRSLWDHDSLRDPTNLQPYGVTAAARGADVDTGVGWLTDQQISPVPSSKIWNFKLCLTLHPSSYEDLAFLAKMLHLDPIMYFF